LFTGQAVKRHGETEKPADRHQILWTVALSELFILEKKDGFFSLYNYVTINTKQ